MSDVKNAYDEIVDFFNNETEKTLLLCGIADEKKQLALLKSLKAQGSLKGLVFLIHTAKNGIRDFFEWAGYGNIKVPNKYGEAMKLSNLTIFFDNLTTKSGYTKYSNYPFDFMIIWPIQTANKNEGEIQQLKEMAKHQKAKKIIYVTTREPWYSPALLKPFVDRIIKLDCENDDPEGYQRIMNRYEEDIRIRDQWDKFENRV